MASNIEKPKADIWKFEMCGYLSTILSSNRVHFRANEPGKVGQPRAFTMSIANRESECNKQQMGISLRRSHRRPPFPSPQSELLPPSPTERKRRSYRRGCGKRERARNYARSRKRKHVFARARTRAADLGVRRQVDTFRLIVTIITDDDVARYFSR